MVGMVTVLEIEWALLLSTLRSYSSYLLLAIASVKVTAIFFFLLESSCGKCFVSPSTLFLKISFFFLSKFSLDL